MLKNMAACASRLGESRQLPLIPRGSSELGGKLSCFRMGRVVQYIGGSLKKVKSGTDCNVRWRWDLRQIPVRRIRACDRDRALYLYGIVIKRSYTDQGD